MKTKTIHATYNPGEGLKILWEMAEKGNWTGPKDLSKNHDKYFIKEYEKKVSRKG